MRASVCLLLACALGGCATRLPYQCDWIQLETPHFRITSSLGHDETRALAGQLEGFRHSVGLVLGRSLSEPAAPIPVFALDDRSLTRPFAVRGKRGFLLTGLRGPVLVLRAGGGWPGDATLELRHQLAHELIRRDLGLSLPLWLDEGLAQFSAPTHVGDRSVAIGRHRDDTVRLLRGAYWPGAENLIQAESPNAFPGRDPAVFSAGSWLLVHYLAFGVGAPVRIPLRLDPYLERVEEEQPYALTVGRGLGVEPSSLDKSLNRYLRGDRFDSIELRLHRPEGTLRERALSRAEATSRLGWLLVGVGSWDEAANYFERAIAAEPGLARAHAGLGAVARQRGRFGEARSRYARALGLAPDDALVQLELGDSSREQAEAANDPSEVAELAETARRHYRASEAVDPSRAAAPALRATTHLLPGQDPALAVAPLARARRLRPASLELELLAARVHAALGQHARARAEAAGVAARTHSRPLAEAAQQLLNELRPDAGPDPSSISGSGQLDEARVAAAGRVRVADHLVASRHAVAEHGERRVDVR
jgi:tetratricopeptide (TPR) repeat protein